MKNRAYAPQPVRTALRAGAVALAGHALLSATAEAQQAQQDSTPRLDTELRNPALVREAASRFGRAGEAARRIEQSPAGQSRGSGPVHRPEIREAGQALRELHGVQRINPMEGAPSAPGTARSVPGQGLPAEEQARLGSPEIPGMPSPGLPDNRSKRPSNWIGGPADLRGAARGIAGDEDESAPPPPPGTPADQNRRTPEGLRDAASGRGTVDHERQAAHQSVYFHTDEDGNPVATVVENDRPDGGVEGTVYKYTSNGTRVISYLRSAQGRTTVESSRMADSTDELIMAGIISRSLNRSHTQDTYTGPGSGVNPLTGLPTRQARRHPDQVNPDRSGVAESLGGPRLRAGDDIATNPDPDRHRRTGTPDANELHRRLEEGRGPGGIPEPPAAGPDSAAR